MVVDASPESSLKRRKFTTDIDSMEAQEAQAKLTAAKEKFGREIRVFETSTPSSSQNQESNNTAEDDDELEFSAADYYRILKVKEDNVLKTRKIREAEQAARRSRSRITKTVIRVRLPDNHTLEATFHPSEKVQSLVDLLMKVVARPQLPFYIYTTPPKKQIKDMEQDFYSAGFVPGAIVYFSYDIPKDDAADAKAGPFLQEEIMSLKGLELSSKLAEPVDAAPETKPEVPPPTAVQENKSAEKKPAKPKWFKR